MSYAYNTNDSETRSYELVTQQLTHGGEEQWNKIEERIKIKRRR